MNALGLMWHARVAVASVCIMFVATLAVAAPTRAAVIGATQQSGVPAAQVGMLEAIASDVPTPVPSLSTATTTTVRNADGSLTLTGHEMPVNYQDDSGAWIPISNDLVDAPGSNYAVQNEANSFTALIPENPASTPVKLESDDSWISMRMVGLSGAPDVMDDTATFDASGAADSVAYTVTSQGIKENIILAEPPAAATSPSFIYAVDASEGVTPHMLDSGSIEFRREDGTVVGGVPLGYMLDSATEPSTSENVVYTLASSGDHWVLTVIPDASWLTSPERVYPVTIDPSLWQGGTTLDCWIRSAVPSGSYCGVNSVYLKTGRENANSKYRALLKFNLGIIPKSSTITGAVMNLYLDRSQTYSNLATTYGFFNLSRAFPANTNWYYSGGDAFGQMYGGQYTAGQTGGWITFNGLEGMVQAWVNDWIPNHGVMLAPQTETNNVIGFKSSSSQNSGKQPFFTVTYTEPHPPGPVGTYHSLGPAGTYPSFTPGVYLAPNSTTTVSTQSVGGISDPYPVAFLETYMITAAWGGPGSITVYDPDDTAPASPTVSWTSDDDPNQGVRAVSTVGVSGNETLAVRNNSPYGTWVQFWATGWYDWTDLGEPDGDEEQDPVVNATSAVTFEPAASGKGSLGRFTVSNGSVTQTSSTQTCDSSAMPIQSTQGQATCLGQVDTTGLAAMLAAEGLPSNYFGNPPTQLALDSAVMAQQPTSDEGALAAFGVIENAENAGATNAPSLSQSTSCFQNGMSYNTWYKDRFQRCLVATRVVNQYAIVTGQPPELTGTAEINIYQWIVLNPGSGDIKTTYQVQITKAFASAKVVPILLEFTSVCFDPCNGSDVTKFAVASWAGTKTSAPVTWTHHAGLTGTSVTGQRSVYGGLRALPGLLPVPDWVSIGDGAVNIRCDSMTYFSRVGAVGCVSSDYSPTWELPVTANNSEAAIHIAKAQYGKSYPYGLRLFLTPLTRGTHADAKANRKAACSTFTKSYANGSCDEFPMASTEQGCSYIKRAKCSVCEVNKFQNFSAGGSLSWFYASMRVVRSADLVGSTDPFWVKVTPSSAVSAPPLRCL